jgi:hypothetical protein
MQTFLLSNDVVLSASLLDSKRLFKQCVEAKQIYLTLKKKSAWSNHPAVLMWEHDIPALLYYAITHCHECIKRGINATDLLDFFLNETKDILINDPQMKSLVKLPEWVTPQLILSHKSNLIHKNPQYYVSKFPNIGNNLLYVWPSYYKNQMITMKGAKSLLKTCFNRVKEKFPDIPRVLVEDEIEELDFYHDNSWISAYWLIKWKKEGLLK